MLNRLFLATFLLFFSIQAHAVLGWADNGSNTAGIDSVTGTTAISTTATMGPVGVASCDSSADCWTSDGTNGIEKYRNFYDVSDGTCNTDVDVTTAAYTDERAVDIDFSAGVYDVRDSGGTMLDTFPLQGEINFKITFPTGFSSADTVGQELVFKSNVLSSPNFDRYRTFMQSSDGTMVFNIYNGGTSTTLVSTTTNWLAGKEYAISTKYGTGGMEFIVNGVSEASNAVTTVPNTGTHFDFLVGLHFNGSSNPGKFIVRDLVIIENGTETHRYFPGYIDSTTIEDKTGSNNLTLSNSALWTFNTSVNFGGMYPSTALCGETRLLDSAGAIDPDATDEVAITTTTVTKPSWHSNDTDDTGVFTGSGGYINKASNDLAPLGENCDQLGGDGALNCLANGTYPVERVRVYYEGNPSGTCNTDDIVNVATGLNYIERYPNYYNFSGLYYGTQATLLVTPPAIFEIRGKIETNSTSQTRLWTKRQDALPLYEVYLEMMSTGKLRFTQYLAGTAKIINSQTVVNDGDMVPGGDDTHTYKVVIAAGTNAVELWVDGTLEASITGAALISEVDNIDFHIGSDSGGGFKFDGIQYYLDVYDVSGSAYLARYHFIDDFGGTVLDDSTGSYDITLTSGAGWVPNYTLDLNVLSLGTEYCIESVAVDSEGVASSYTGTEQRAYIVWNDFYVKPENGQVVVSSIADALTSYTVDHYDLFYAESTTVSPTVYDSYVNAVANPYTLTGLTNYDGMAVMKVPCLDTSAPCTNYVDSALVTTSPSNDYTVQTAWANTDQETVAYSSGTEKSKAIAGGFMWANRAVGEFVKSGNRGDPNNTFIRVTFEGARTQTQTITQASICQQAFLNDYPTYTSQHSCVDNPVRLTFGGGNNGGSVSAAGTLVSDWVPFPLDTGKGVVGSEEPGFWVRAHNSDNPAYYTEVANTGALTSVNTATGNDSADPEAMVFIRDFNNFSSDSAVLTGLGKIEIMQAAPVQTRLNNDDAGITYTGTWSAITDSKYFMGDAQKTTTLNDYLEFTETGCAFFVTFGSSFQTSNVLSVTVDDLAYGTVDLQSHGDSNWNHFDSMLVYEDSTCGTHTIRLTKDTATVSTEIDAIVVITGHMSNHEIGNNYSAYGDSLTSFAFQNWVQTVADEYGYTVFNHGVPGGMWSGVINNMFDSLHDEKPRLVTMMAGSNHQISSWADKKIIQDRVRTAIAYAYYMLPSYSKIVVMEQPLTTRTDLTNPTGDERGNAMNGWVKEVVSEYPGVYWAAVHDNTVNSPQYLDTGLVHYTYDQPIANAVFNARVLR